MLPPILFIHRCLVLGNESYELVLNRYFSLMQESFTRCTYHWFGECYFLQDYWIATVHNNGNLLQTVDIFFTTIITYLSKLISVIKIITTMMGCRHKVFLDIFVWYKCFLTKCRRPFVRNKEWKYCFSWQNGWEGLVFSLVCWWTN